VTWLIQRLALRPQQISQSTAAPPSTNNRPPALEKVPRLGVEQQRGSPQETNNSKGRGADSGATESNAARSSNDQPDTELASLIDAWPELPDAIRAGIVAIVQATIKPVSQMN
jgi:hypothetical protein